MEMVTAVPVNVNAQLTMSMHKIAHIMDVSTSLKPLFFFLLSNKTTMHFIPYTEKVRLARFQFAEKSIKIFVQNTYTCKKIPIVGQKIGLKISYMHIPVYVNSFKEKLIFVIYDVC